MAVQRVASEARHRFAKTNSKRIAFYANRLFTPVTIFHGAGIDSLSMVGGGPKKTLVLHCRLE